MPPPTLVITQPTPLMAIPLVQTAQVNGWQIIKTVGGRLPAEAMRGPVALFGNWQQACLIAQSNRLILLAPDAEWILRLPPEFLGRKINILAWEQARGLSEPHYFKAVDWPEFAPQVYMNGQQLAEQVELPDESRIMVSPPVTYEYEFRCFVNQGSVTTLSPYRHRGESCQQRGSWKAPEPMHDEATEFCEMLLADPRVEAPPALAVDVGLVAEVGWLVVAAHACWHADLYGCNSRGVLEALLQSCRNHFNIAAEDERWGVHGVSLTA